MFARNALHWAQVHNIGSIVQSLYIIFQHDF
jgi:hypothetical protein